MSIFQAAPPLDCWPACASRARSRRRDGARRARRRSAPGRQRESSSTVSRRDFVKSVRLSGSVEAVEATTISTPRLAGQNNQSLVITKLVRPGQHGAGRRPRRRVRPAGSAEERARPARRAERSRTADPQEAGRGQRRAGQGRQRAHAGRELRWAARSSRSSRTRCCRRSRPRRTPRRSRRRRPTLKQLKTTYDLKRKAAEADLRILQIRRDRAENAMRQAESNAERMAIKSPIGGMAVLRTIWKSNNMAEVQEGEEVRGGMPIVDVVNPGVDARAGEGQPGGHQRAEARPRRSGSASTPIPTCPSPAASRRSRRSAVTSTLSPKVRNFIALIAVDGAHPNLMPDLTASLDVETRAPARRARRAARRAPVRRRAGVRARAARQRLRRPDGHGRRDERPRGGRDVGARRRRGRRAQRRSPRAGARDDRARRAWRPCSGRGRRARLPCCSSSASASPPPSSASRTSAAPDLPTTEVTRGQFVDAIEIRGDIRPLKSIVLSSPMQSASCRSSSSPSQRLDGQGRRRRGVVRRLDPAADDAGEAVGVEAGGCRDRAGDARRRASPDEQNATELMRSKLQHPARQARSSTRATPSRASRTSRPS